MRFFIVFYFLLFCSRLIYSQTSIQTTSDNELLTINIDSLSNIAKNDSDRVVLIFIASSSNYTIIDNKLNSNFLSTYYLIENYRPDECRRNKRISYFYNKKIIENDIPLPLLLITSYSKFFEKYKYSKNKQKNFKIGNVNFIPFVPSGDTVLNFYRNQTDFTPLFFNELASSVHDIFTSSLDSVLNKLIIKCKSEFESYYSIPLYSLNNVVNINYTFNRKNSFSLNYNFYPFIKSRWLGAGIVLNIEKLDFNLTSDNITDTLKPVMYDNDGDKYFKIVYTKGIKENITIQTLNIIPHLSFNFIEKKRWNITVNPGLKITSILSCYYNATEGNVSYGSLYPSYSKDTIFSGINDNYQNQPIYSQKQRLQIKNTLLSLYVPVNFQIEIFNNIYFSIGGFYEKGLSNILNNNPQEKIISYNVDNYNSLLYRQQNIKINSYGFYLGLAYKF